MIYTFRRGCLNPITSQELLKYEVNEVVTSMTSLVTVEGQRGYRLAEKRALVVRAAVKTGVAVVVARAS